MPVPALLINLDRDPDRLTHMTGEFARAGLSFERIPGVLGTAMPDWAKPDFLDAQGRIASTLKPGEVGCYASHLVAARTLLDRNWPAALVAEDDLILPSQLGPLLEEALTRLPPDWDLLRLSNPVKAPYRVVASLSGGFDLVLYSRVPNNTGAQLLSISGARKLLAGGARRMPIDEHMRRPWLMGLETYGIVPMPIRSNIFDSTIDAMGDRALSGEGFWKKLRRRHWPRPADLIRQIRWQIAHLGFGGYLGSILLSAAHSVTKRIAPKLASRIRAGFALRGRD